MAMGITNRNRSHRPHWMSCWFFLSFCIADHGASSFQLKSTYTPSRKYCLSKTLASESERRSIVKSFSYADKSMESTKGSKRAKFFNLLGFKRLITQNKKSKVAIDERVEITTVEALNAYFEDPNYRFRVTNRDTRSKTKDKELADSPIDYKSLLSSISIKGNTQIIGSKEHPNVIHPVLQLLQERRKQNSKPVNGIRADGFKIALAIEGGGMRGCVSAGMVVAIDYLGLRECIDVVYGSSAGSLIGSYFLTNQLPWFGPEIYYDSLTTAGTRFIDTKRLFRALGLGLADPRLIKDVITRRGCGKPVLNLDFLLKYTTIERKPLDWEKFEKLQKVQPLKVVTSGLKSEKSFVLDYEKGSFNTLYQFTECMHASMLLPGIAGPVMNMIKEPNGEVKFALSKELDENNTNIEPMIDALVYEPIPYRSAIKEGATHVVVLRTRPDGVDVTGKPSLFEGLIFKRFFMRKNNLRHIFHRMQNQLHKKLYGEDVIILNDAAHDVDRDYKDVSSPHIMPIALPPGSEEVTRLETGRDEIFEGVRRGFARAYDALVDDPNERGRGAVVAREVFPDRILEYDPLQIDGKQESAFATYLKQEEASTAI